MPARRGARSLGEDIRLTRFMFTGALTSYIINCLLGTGVATGRIDTSHSRWVHHLIYIATASLTVAGIVSAFVGAGTNVMRWGSVPAGVALALIPKFKGTSSQHIVIAATVAPSLLLSTTIAWRDNRAAS